MKLNDPHLALPPQPISLDVLLEKYAKGDERTIDDVRRRVARALAAVETDPAHWEPIFLEALENGFVPAGRIKSAAGTQLEATLINCFVQPVGDSVSQVVRRQARHLHGAARSGRDDAARRRGRLRLLVDPPERRAASAARNRSASGPVSYMRVFDQSCETVESAGSRRGAQMGILRCDHPDIEEFIHAKDSGDLRNFNVSVGVTDDFMRAVETDADWELVHKAIAGRRVAGSGATSAAMACGYIARCARASCGSKSCGRPTITPSRACCSSIA